MYARVMRVGVRLVRARAELIESWGDFGGECPLLRTTGNLRPGGRFFTIRQ